MADAGIRLTVEGEKEFKAALAEIDAAVKSNQKAMKSLTEEFKLNETGMKAAAEGIGAAAGESTKAFGSMADAVEILKTKGKVLADSIEMQEEKFGLLNERVEEARKTYGEYDKRTMELKNQLLDASTALTKLNNEYEKNQQAILDAEHSTKEYDDAVKALEAQLAANQAELKNMGGGLDALKKEYGDLEGESSALEKITGAVGKAFGGLGADSENLEKKMENLGKQNETLLAENEKLTSSIDIQKRMVEQLAAAQKQAADRYGEGSRKAQEYSTRIAETTGLIDQMSRELQENEKAIEDNNKAIESGGDAPLEMLDGLKAIEKMTGLKLPKSIETMIGGLKAGPAAVGGIVTMLVEVGKHMEEIWRNTVDWADEISTRSAELGTGTTRLQELDHVASELGIDISNVEGALGRIVPKAGEGMLQTSKELQDLIDKQDEAGQAADEAREKYNEASKTAAEAYDKYAEANAAAYEAQKRWIEVSGELQRASRGSEDYNKIAEKLQPWLDKYEEAAKIRDEAKAAYEKEQKALIDLEGEYTAAREEVDHIAETVQALTDKKDSAVVMWEEFGIALTDASGKARDSVDVLVDVLEWFGENYDNVYERTAAMAEVFGRNTAVAMNAMIEAGIPKVRELMEEAHKYNLVTGDEQVAAIDKAGKALDRYEAKQEAIDRQYVGLRASQGGFFEDMLTYISQLGEKMDELSGMLIEGADYKPQSSGNYSRQSNLLNSLDDWLASLFAGLGWGPKYASGTNFAPGGMALVGERGPEIVELPRGSKVYPNGTAPELAGGSVVNESNVYNITIDAASVEEFNDIVRIAQGARVGMRRG